MKKKQLIIFSVVIVALIVVVSVFYPPAEESESKGTIGKVDKYRSDETGQSKVVLRNDFLQDTTALKNVIISLQMYENFANTLAKDYDEWSSSLKQVSLNSEQLNEQLKTLDDLKHFVDNNIEKVTDTKVLLLKYFIKDTVDMTIDVENNLIEFSTFVTNFDKKADAADQLFKNLDGIIKEENLAKLSLTKEEAETLKEVREKMLGGIVFTAMTMNNSDRLNLALGSTVLNIRYLNRQLNNNLLGLIVLINSKENLGIHNNVKLENALAGIGAFAKQELGSAVIFNKDQLNGLFNKGLLGGVELEANILGNNASAFNNKALGRIFNTENLGIVLRDKQYVFSQEKLGAWAKENLGMWRAKDNLGAGFSSIESLMAFRSMAGTFNAFRLGNTEALRFAW